MPLIGYVERALANLPAIARIDQDPHIGTIGVYSSDFFKSITQRSGRTYLIASFSYLADSSNMVLGTMAGGLWSSISTIGG